MVTGSFRRGFTQTPRVLDHKSKEKMAAPNNAFYVLDQAHAGLPNSVLFNTLFDARLITEGDARFVNLTGDTMTGNLAVNAEFDVNDTEFIVKSDGVGIGTADLTQVVGGFGGTAQNDKLWIVDDTADKITTIVIGGAGGCIQFTKSNLTSSADFGQTASGKLFFVNRIVNKFITFQVNDGGATGDPRVYCEGSSPRVGIINESPQAALDVKQKLTTAAVPVLILDQTDISEEMIEFKTTIGTGNAIEAIGAKTLTTTHFIKITIPGGLTRYIPCGTIA